MNKLLEVKNLKTSFFLRRGVIKAVNGVSFSLKQGETLGIVGESGCGKTMTALSIMRLVPSPGRIVEGKIVFENNDLLDLSSDQMREVRGKKIAIIFQDPMTSLNPVLTITRQITEAMETHLGINGKVAREKAIELLNTVGIPSAEERIDDYPHQFSGGMRQRVMIAMALSCKPKLLIADEPTTALDVTIQAQILELIGNICRELGTSVILITHNLGIVAGLCQKLAVMYAGCIVESADVREIFANPKHPYTLGLLTSTPRLDKIDRRLSPIGGSPPSLLNPPSRCAFVPRCRYAQSKCRKGNPPLESISPGHSVACWRNQEHLGVG